MTDHLGQLLRVNPIFLGLAATGQAEPGLPPASGAQPGRHGLPGSSHPGSSHPWAAAPAGTDGSAGGREVGRVLSLTEGQLCPPGDTE